MARLNLLHSRCWQIKVFTVVLLGVAILSACLPQSLEPYPVSESVQNDVGEGEKTPTPTHETTLDEAPIQASPTISISPTIIPDVVPQVLNNQPAAMDVITRTVSSSDSLEIAHDFSDSGRLVGLLPNDNLILQEGSNLLGLLNLADLSKTSVLQNSILPVIPFGENKDLIVPVDNASKNYPIWSVDLESGETILLGRTTGYFPFFSSSANGKVLLLEAGHLVIKWFDGQSVQSQQLSELESSIGLMWSNYDLTQSPGSSSWEVTPWIDFEISPDGQWVALFDGLEAKMWIGSVDGQTVQSIPIDPEILQQSTSSAIEARGSQVVFLGWSPDSRTLAYREGVWADKPGYRYQQIKLVSVNNFETVSLTSATNSIGGTAAWSPDGQHIAYVLQPYSPPPDSDDLPFGSLLYVADSIGMNPRDITESWGSKLA